jgi:hypothetical protein
VVEGEDSMIVETEYGVEERLLKQRLRGVRIKGGS